MHETADRRWAGQCSAKTCQQCHTLYGVGAHIGPDLTGSNRSDRELPALEHRRSQRGHCEGVSADGRRHDGWPRNHGHRDGRKRQVTDASHHYGNDRHAEERNRRAYAERNLDDAGRSAQAILDPRTLSLFAYLRGKEQVPMLGHQGQRRQLLQRQGPHRLERRTELVVGRKWRNRWPHQGT